MLTFGNTKLASEIGIFNMSTATDCRSKKLGLCNALKCKIKCYALKNELRFKDHVINHRIRQSYYWNILDKYELTDMFINKIKQRRKQTRYIRFNEAGDFNNQEDITKLNYIAKELKKEDIIIYGYTSRSDLNYPENLQFLCKSSGFYNPNLNGMTSIINNKEELQKDFYLCNGKCYSNCNLCLTNNKYNISFIKH